MRFSAHYTFDGHGGVESRCDCAAGSFDGRDGGGGGAGYDDVDRGLEMLGVLGEGHIMLV